MNTKEEINFRDIVQKHNLFPLIPIIEYDDYHLHWRDDSENQVILRTIEECENYIPPKNRRITGYSIYTGEKSNLIVLDLDVHGDGSINGIENFKNIISQLPLTDQKIINNTLTILTKRNGRHLYFKYNSELNKKLSFDGIELLTNGNIVPLPGSKRRMHPPKDKTVGTYRLSLDCPIQPMPQSLIDIIKNHYKKPKTPKRGRPKESSKYYKNVVEHEGRDDTLISWLGHMVKCNPNLRNKDELLPLAEMYNSKYFTPPMEAKEVDDKVNSILKMAEPPYIDKKGKIIRGELANILIEEMKYKYYMNKNFIYNGSYYEEWGSIHDLRKKVYSYVSTESEDTRMANEVISLMHDKSSIKNSKDIEYITVNNGLIHIKNNELIPHNENIFTTVKINCDYTNDWEKYYEDSKIQKFLTTTFKNDNALINMAIEIMGMSLLPNPKAFQHAIFLLGDGSNGKSIFINIIKELHGGYVASEEVSSMCDKSLKRWCVSAMLGKKVNIQDDASECKLNDTGLFKSLCTGGVVRHEEKGEKIGDPVTLPILLICSGNALPISNDNSHGFERRFLIIPFDQKFVPKESLKLPQNKDALPCDDLIESKILNDEMHIVLGLALEGLQRVLKRNYNFKQIYATKQAFNKYKSKMDPIYEFVEYIREGEYFIEKITGSQFRFIYERWCELNNKSAVGNRIFGEHIKQYYECKNGRIILYLNVDMPKEYLNLLNDIKYSLKQNTETPITQTLEPKKPTEKPITWANMY